MIYYISKLFTAFFLPPGIIILTLALAAWFTKRFKPMFLFLSFLFYLLSISPVANSLLGPFETPYRHTILPKKADAVIMLGGGAVENSPNLALRDEPFKRALYSLSIAKSKNLPLIVSGGGTRKYKESQAFLDTIHDLSPILSINCNISDHYQNHFTIIPEGKSLDTYQNAIFSRQLLPQLKPRVIVVTSAYHMKRSLMLFKYAGMKAFPAATDFHISKAAYNFLDFLPHMEALQNSYRAMHEFFGILKLKLRELQKRW